MVINSYEETNDLITPQRKQHISEARQLPDSFLSLKLDDMDDGKSIASPLNSLENNQNFVNSQSVLLRKNTPKPNRTLTNIVRELPQKQVSPVLNCRMPSKENMKAEILPKVSKQIKSAVETKIEVTQVINKKLDISQTQLNEVPRYLRPTASFTSKAQPEIVSPEVLNQKVQERGRKMLTMAQSIKLQTKSRARLRAESNNERVLSQAEREELFMKNIKPFKARKISDKIMHSIGEVGLPKVFKKPPTECQEFQFRTTVRASSRAQSAEPRVNEPLKPKLSVNKVERPFRRSIERHEAVVLRRENERKEIEERRALEVHNFKAHPLPDFSFVSQPPKPPVKRVTLATTPKVLVKSRLSQEMFQKQVEQEKLEALSKTHFLAHGLPETTYNPERLVVPKSKRPTISMTPHLSSEERAKDRLAFDEKVKSFKQHEEEMHRIEEEKRRLQEELDLKEYRKTLVHRALPVPARISKGKEINLSGDNIEKEVSIGEDCKKIKILRELEIVQTCSDNLVLSSEVEEAGVEEFNTFLLTFTDASKDSK